MKRILFLSLLISFFAAESQIVKVDSLTHWRKSFKAGLNLNQSQFSGNWKAGGVNSLGFTTLLNFKANYQKDKVSWDSEFDFLYGMVNNAGQGYRKTLDRIYFDTKYGHALSSKWNMYVALNFQMQFAKGYKYLEGKVNRDSATLISDFLAPAFITTSIGFQYQPSPAFKVRISPFSPRITIVKDPTRLTKTVAERPYGVDSTKIVRYEWLAAQILAEFNKDLAPNFNLKFRYLMFANYEHLNLKEIDHRLDVLLTAKVSRFINASLTGILLYDYDQDSGLQFREAFSLGILYTFQNYKS